MKPRTIGAAEPGDVPRSKFRPGDTVAVVDGPDRGTSGTVEEIVRWRTGTTVRALYLIDVGEDDPADEVACWSSQLRAVV